MLHRILRFLPLLLAALLPLACDTSENDSLLNPPENEATLIRSVNLIAGEQVDRVVVKDIPVTTDLPSLHVSAFQELTLREAANLITIRAQRSDTLFAQNFADGARITLFLFGTSDTTFVLPRQVSRGEEADLAARNVSRLIFVNAIPDTGISGGFLIKQGCRSGDTLFGRTGYRGNASRELSQREVSLYLFNAADSGNAVTSARLTLEQGRVAYLVAALLNGEPNLFLLSTNPDAPGGPLQVTEPETRDEAGVELLNALVDGSTISATAAGSGDPVAVNLPPLQLSVPAVIQACLNPDGDALAIATAGSADPDTTPIRLTIGSQVLVVAYGTAEDAGTVVLERSSGFGPGSMAHVRAVNASTLLPSASPVVGGGAPEDVPVRPFGTLKLGTRSGWMELPTGDYPFLLRSGNGAFAYGGAANLSPGYYTLLILDSVDTPVMRLLREEETGSALSPLSPLGNQALLFNMMPDVEAEFTVGSLTVKNVAYSYVASALVPFGTGTIMSNAGQVSLPQDFGNLIVGATGTEGNRELILFEAPPTLPSSGKAYIRMVNAVPGAGTLELHETDSLGPILGTSDFGTPSELVERDVRRYSYVVTPQGSQEVVARITGVELSDRQRYLLVVGPKREDLVSDNLRYGTLWMQE